MNISSHQCPEREWKVVRRPQKSGRSSFLLSSLLSPLSCSIFSADGRKNRDGRVRTGDLLLPGQAESQLSYIPIRTRHPVRAAGFEPAISSSPSLRISQTFPRPGRPQMSESSPCGNRTHLSALKERYPAPIDERAESHRSGPGGARIHVCCASNSRYTVSATDPFNEQDPVFCDTGPWEILQRMIAAWRHKRLV